MGSWWVNDDLLDELVIDPKLLDKLWTDMEQRKNEEGRLSDGEFKNIYR